jgi:sortase A
MNLRRVNNILLVVIIAVKAIVIILPLMPTASFFWQDKFTDSRINLEETLKDVQVPDTNRLVIPAMMLDEQIHEGPDPDTLDKGLWIRPQASTPPEGSNTVVSAHRFTYTNPEGTFYHLDKLKNGDEIGLYWEGEKYLYKVVESKVVPPSAVEIEQPTERPRLTLYTCTPLWSPTDRLVVIAEPVDMEDGS